MSGLLVVRGGELWKEEPDARLELLRGPLERRVRGVVRVALERRVRHAPVDELGVVRELWTDLSDPVAQGDHLIEVRSGEAAQVLGLVAGDVDASLGEDSHGVGVEHLGMAPRASSLDAVA